MKKDEEQPEDLGTGGGGGYPNPTSPIIKKRKKRNAWIIFGVFIVIIIFLNLI